MKRKARTLKKNPPCSNFTNFVRRFCSIAVPTYGNPKARLDEIDMYLARFCDVIHAVVELVAYEGNVWNIKQRLDEMAI